MDKFYTGVGSRNTPKDILAEIVTIASKLDNLNYVLRSGGAKGADLAFELSCDNSEIFYASDSTPEAEAIASKFHPAWNKCNAYARRLHGRNAFQVLGRDLKTPSKFLICWTLDGCIRHVDRTIRTGGTGTAISIADHYGVKIFNLANHSHTRRLRNL